MHAVRVVLIPIVLLLASCGSGSSSEGDGSASTPDQLDSSPGAVDDVIEPDLDSSPGVVDDVTPPNSDSQLRSQVTFDIMVPTYSSDQLTVDVIWGDVTLAASWIGDNLWTATGDFPMETEQRLVVNFYDRSGAITLASVETRYRTGNNSTESFAIGVDEFDTSRWDDDADGVSNIEELTTGTDPLVDESGQEGDTRTLYFTITVPQYASDELQVRLTVPRISEDDYVFDAQWQGDELWTAQRGGFQNSRAFKVIVEFFDRNGDLKLGSNEKRFSTFNSDPTEIVIDDSFDTRSWDDDGDGRNNYDEVIAGTNPLIKDEGPAPATVIASFGFASMDNNLAWLSHVEARFQALDLPASFSEQIVIEGNYVRDVEDVTYEFSADGEGSYRSELTTYTEGDVPVTFKRQGTRSAQGNTVSWVGTSSVLNEYHLVEHTYDITSSIADKDVVQSAIVDRTQTIVSNGEIYSVYGYEYEVALDADSIDVDRRCQTLSGRISRNDLAGDEKRLVRSASRTTADERWTVSGIDVDSADRSNLPEFTQAETLTTRFFCDFRFPDD